MNFWLPIFLISPLKVTKRGIKLCGDSSRDHKGSHVISTVRRSTPLPACDRVLDFHDASLSLTRGRTGWKDRAVTFSMCNGSPKCSDPFYTFLKTKLLTQLFPDSIFPRSYSRMWLIWICWWADHQTKAHKCRGHERPTSSLVPLLSQRQGGSSVNRGCEKVGHTPLPISIPVTGWPSSSPLARSLESASVAFPFGPYLTHIILPHNGSSMKEIEMWNPKKKNGGTMRTMDDAVPLAIAVAARSRGLTVNSGHLCLLGNINWSKTGNFPSISRPLRPLNPLVWSWMGNLRQLRKSGVEGEEASWAVAFNSHTVKSPPWLRRWPNKVLRLEPEEIKGSISHNHTESPLIIPWSNPTTTIHTETRGSATDLPREHDLIANKPIHMGPLGSGSMFLLVLLEPKKVPFDLESNQYVWHLYPGGFPLKRSDLLKPWKFTCNFPLEEEKSICQLPQAVKATDASTHAPTPAMMKLQ